MESAFIGILIVISTMAFFAVMTVFYLYDKIKKDQELMYIMIDSSIEGIDQNDDGKSYTNKASRVHDKLRRSTNFTTREINEILDRHFPGFKK